MFDCIDCITADECSYLAAGLLYDQNFFGSYPFYKNISYFQADFVLIKMVLYLPNFSLVFLIHVFLYAGVYCIHLRAAKEKQNGFCWYIVINKVALWAASYSGCVVYTKTIIHLSVGESGGYLPPLR